MTEQLTMDLTETTEPTEVKEVKHQGPQLKHYDISDINRRYLEAFQKAKYPNLNTDNKQRMSMNQYRSTINTFCEYFQNDIVTMTETDFNNWAKSIENESTRKNKENHIKSILNFVLSKNVNFARQRASLSAFVFAGIVPEWFIKDKSIINKLNNSD